MYIHHQNIFFTIAIPAYKAIYLAEAIKSVLSQSYKNFELIVVDDASPDNLISIIEMFEDNRIRFYRNERNCGAVNVVDNWNICLGYAKGDFIICMGDDDRLRPNCLEEYVKLIQLYPGKKLYHAWTEIINENSEVYMMQEARPVLESVYSMIWSRWHGRMQYIGDFLFDTKYLIGLGGFYKLPLAWSSDDISAYMVAQNGGVVNSQIPLFQYRINGMNISSSFDGRIKISAILQEKKWYEEFLKTEPTDAVDYVYWNMIRSYFQKYFKKKILYEMARDLYNNSWRNIFFYLCKRKKYNLSIYNYVFILFYYANLRYTSRMM